VHVIKTSARTSVIITNVLNYAEEMQSCPPVTLTLCNMDTQYISCIHSDQLHNDTGSVPANLWRQAILWGHGGTTRRPKLATQ